MSDLTSFFLPKRIMFVVGRVGLTNVLFLAQTPDEFEALLAITDGESISQLFGLVDSVSISQDMLARTMSSTYVNCFDLSTIVANRLQYLLDLSKKTYSLVSEVQQERPLSITIMVDRHSQLDDSKVTWTLGHVFFAGGTLEVAIDRAQMRVV